LISDWFIGSYEEESSKKDAVKKRKKEERIAVAVVETVVLIIVLNDGECFYSFHHDAGVGMTKNQIMNQIGQASGNLSI